MKRRVYALLIVFAGILWGFDGLLRRNLSPIPPTIIVMIEHTVSVLILLPFLPRFIKEYKKMQLKHWIMVIVIAVLSGALAKTLYTTALAKVNYISYSVVVLLQQVRPLFAIILAALFLREKFTKRYALLATIALVAAYFLTFPNYRPNYLHNREEIIAAGMALGAAAMWGSTIILSKILLKKISYIAAVMLRFIIVIPVAGVMSILLNQTYSFSAISATQWIYFLLLSLFAGIASFALYYKGLQYTEVKIATFAEFAWPVSAAMVGYFILHERLTGIQTLSALVLIADILILSLSSQEK